MAEALELLAPAGDRERLLMALRYGADAVYLAGRQFGMRSAAVNFSDEGLREAVRLAHAQGARLYVTCNTLPREEELKVLPPYLEFLQDAGVDALIIADLGVMALAKRHAPKVARHVSTQLGVINSATANVLYELGADTVVLDGGPAMGAVIDPATAIIKKTTKGITLYPNDIPAVTGKFTDNHVVNIHATSNCCQCTRCTDLCPRALLGYPLQPHKIVRTSLSVVAEMPQLFTEATACCGCGVCELVACCQNISPRRVYAQVKAILAKNKLRYSGTAEPEVDPDREYRIVPSTRFQQLIGVLPLDKMPTLRDELQSTASVTLPTRQHVGAPATPCVRNGDTVHTGDVIATANGAISANIHASIDGVVTAVSDSAITIARAQ